jgi:hypothetical protein
MSPHRAAPQQLPAFQEFGGIYLRPLLSDVLQAQIGSARLGPLYDRRVKPWRFAAYHTGVTRGEQTYWLCVEFLVSTTRLAWYRMRLDFQRRSTALRGVVLTIQARGMMPLSVSGIDAWPSLI